MKILPWVQSGLRLLIGGVFLASAAPKIIYPDLFAANVIDYHILGVTSSLALAAVLPWIELVTGLVLLFGDRAVRGGFWIAAGLLTVFIVAQIWVLSQGRHISCGCFSFGQHEGAISPLSVARNLGLLAGAIAGTILTASAGAGRGASGSRRIMPSGSYARNDELSDGGQALEISNAAESHS
jgi:hypothetical protein